MPRDAVRLPIGEVDSILVMRAAGTTGRASPTGVTAHASDQTKRVPVIMRPFDLSADGQQFRFQFAPSYRLPALLFGVTPATTGVLVNASELRVRFWPWLLRTPVSNIASCQETGGFRFLRTAGPAHLSLADRGVTFATNPDSGVCILFREPVKAIEPTGRILHPGATLTVAEPDAFVGALREFGA